MLSRKTASERVFHQTGLLTREDAGIGSRRVAKCALMQSEARAHASHMAPYSAHGRFVWARWGSKFAGPPRGEHNRIATGSQGHVYG